MVVGHGLPVALVVPEVDVLGVVDGVVEFGVVELVDVLEFMLPGVVDPLVEPVAVVPVDVAPVVVSVVPVPALGTHGAEPGVVGVTVDPGVVVLGVVVPSVVVGVVL